METPRPWVEALTDALNQSPNEAWLITERDQFVDGLRGLVFDSEGSIGPAVYAFEAVNQGMPMDDFDAVVLTSAAVISLCGHVAQDGGEPADRFLELLQKAERAMARLDPEPRDAVSDLLGMAFDQYARGVALARQQLVNEVTNALGGLQMQLAGVPRRRVNWTAVRSSTRPMRDALKDTKLTLTKLAGLARDPELASALREFAANVDEMIRELDRFVR